MKRKEIKNAFLRDNIKTNFLFVKNKTRSKQIIATEIEKTEGGKQVKGQKPVTEFRVMSLDERVSEKNNETKQRKAETKFECLGKKKIGRRRKNEFIEKTRKTERNEST